MKFCATSMIIFNIAEAAAIIIASAYWLMMGTISGGISSGR